MVPAVRREEFGWWSERMGMYMPIVRYGHWGPGLLLFPTWQSDLWEAEQRGLIAAIGRHLSAGRLSVFCVNSVAPHAWCNDWVTMPEKAQRQAAYSGYIEHEVVPHIRGVLNDAGARLFTAGASFGAFFAANALFRRPDLFRGLVGMSGFYQLEQVLHGYSDENIYLNSPEWFVPQLPDGPALELLRSDCEIHLLTGQGAWEHPELTLRFSDVLRAREIPHQLDVWGHDMPHEWVTWKKMLDVAICDRLKL
jgi:esterase/lipase superfamily enzyme